MLDICRVSCRYEFDNCRAVEQHKTPIHCVCKIIVSQDNGPVKQLQEDSGHSIYLFYFRESLTQHRKNTVSEMIGSKNDTGSNLEKGRIRLYLNEKK